MVPRPNNARMLELVQLPITMLEPSLSVRSENLLKEAGIFFFGGLLAKTMEELANLPGAKPMYIREIDAVVKSYGCQMGQYHVLAPQIAQAPHVEAIEEIYWRHFHSIITSNADIENTNILDWVGRPITDLGLHGRTEKYLQGMGIQYVGQLLAYRDEDLDPEQMHGFGPKSKNDVVQALAQHGLKLGIGYGIDGLSGNSAPEKIQDLYRTHLYADLDYLDVMINLDWDIVDGLRPNNHIQLANAFAQVAFRDLVDGKIAKTYGVPVLSLEQAVAHVPTPIKLLLAPYQKRNGGEVVVSPEFATVAQYVHRPSFSAWLGRQVNTHLADIAASQYEAQAHDLRQRYGIAKLDA